MYSSNTQAQIWVIDKISKIKEVLYKKLLKTSMECYGDTSTSQQEKKFLDVLECIKILKLSVSYLKS